VPNEYVAVRFSDARNQENEAIAASEADPLDNPISTGPLGRLTTNLGVPISAFNSSVEPVSVPIELTNLADLSQLPIVLGAFLAVLGLAALSYVLVISGRARKAEFAVFKALGLDEKMSRSIVYFQASVIATIGLVVGVPLGVIVGRWGWSAVTTRVPLVDIPPLSALVVVLAIPVVLVASNAIAVLPARRVARAKPAETLRSE
jgi:ABC-type antimicrobial peptide transport system permease subunit